MKRRKRALLVLSSAVAVGLLGILFTRGLVDFPIYYIGGQSLLAGRTDLYSDMFAGGPTMTYRYPPFFLVALIPLWLMLYPVAAYVWYLLSVSAIALSVLILRRVNGHLKPTKVVWALSLLAVAQYFLVHLRYGNAHLITITLLFASLYLTLTKRQTAGAALMALAVTIKLTPVLILPYFAIKKQWRYLFLVGAFIVALNLLPSLYFGIGKNAQLLSLWYRHVVVDQEFHEMNGPINLSLKGQLRRYLSEVDYTQRLDGYSNYPPINLASLSKEQTDRVWMLAASAAFMSVLALIWWRSRDAREELDLKGMAPLELGLMICLMLFVGPLTSKIYFVALLWPVVSLASFALRRAEPAATFSKRALAVIAVMNLVLPLLPGRSVQRLLLVLGVDFYLNLLLMAAVSSVLVLEARRLQAQDGGRQRPVLSPTTPS